MIENIIPIVISLKQKLQAAKSPLISDIFNYLRKLMEDYKNEVKDILAADKQLAKEIEFDLRRHEQQQEEERQQREEQELRKRRQLEEEPLGEEGAGRNDTPNPAELRDAIQKALAETVR